MIPYNPSSFNSNKTILEQILELKRWLIAHPSYKLYTTYLNYYPTENRDVFFNDINGDSEFIESIAIGDIIVFGDANYASVESVTIDPDDMSNSYATIAIPVSSFRGPQGPQGADGTNGTNGADGTCIRKYSGNSNANPSTLYAISNLNFNNGLQQYDLIYFNDGYAGFVSNVNVGLSSFQISARFYVNGTNGADGAYVSNASVDANGDLIITIYDPETSIATQVNAGYVVGPQGPSGSVELEIAYADIGQALSDSDYAICQNADKMIVNYGAGQLIEYTRDVESSTEIKFARTYNSGVDVILVTKATKVVTNPTYKFIANSIDSQTATSGQVLQADGNGGASWQNAGGGSVEGVDVLSTGVNIGKFLKSNGTGGAVWDNASTGKNIHYVRLDCSSPYMRIYFSFVDVSSTSSTTITQVINRLSASMSQSWILANGLYVYQNVAYPIYAIASQNGVLQIGYNDGTTGQTITSSQVTLTVNYDKVFIL